MAEPAVAVDAGAEAQAMDADAAPAPARVAAGAEGGGEAAAGKAFDVEDGGASPGDIGGAMPPPSERRSMGAPVVKLGDCVVLKVPAAERGALPPAAATRACVARPDTRVAPHR